MSIAAWLKTISTLVALLYKAVEAYENWEAEQRGRTALLLELRLKHDHDKEKVNEIDARLVPADDQPILDRL